MLYFFLPLSSSEVLNQNSVYIYLLPFDQSCLVCSNLLYFTIQMMEKGSVHKVMNLNPFVYYFLQCSTDDLVSVANKYNSVSKSL